MYVRTPEVREVFNPLWGIAVGSSIGMSATIDK